jgi:hypothetical protein
MAGLHTEDLEAVAAAAHRQVLLGLLVARLVILMVIPMTATTHLAKHICLLQIQQDQAAHQAEQDLVDQVAQNW